MDENSILVIRGAGPVGLPGSAEVVNMQPSDELIKQGVIEFHALVMEDNQALQEVLQF